MPRRRRGLEDNTCYHVTHRCHKREFLFKFAKDRERYTELLRETVHRYRIDVLNYVVTSNHVHLLIWVHEADELPKAMQFLQGEFAQTYNKRKRREGAFWRDRYHSSMIQTGEHLGRCLFYIDMNMVRAGAVKHPRDWRHGGHLELSGARQRYRIVNVARLLECLGRNADQLDAFRHWYELTLNDKLQSSYQVREPFWTEAFAIGDRDWVEAMHSKFGFTRKKILAADASNDLMLGDQEVPYYFEG
jgi:putative transposase